MKADLHGSPGLSACSPNRLPGSILAGDPASVRSSRRTGARYPDFIVVGAAKCGTTALWQRLNRHPDVHMSSIKEPGYFSFAGRSAEPRNGPYDRSYVSEIVSTAEDYTELFADAGTRLAGEASPVYLNDPQAASRIRRANPDCKIVVMLRNPVDRAFSAFMHHVRDGLETTFDFAEALAREDRRMAEGWMWSYGYRRNGLYSDALRRFFREFPREQLHVVLHHEFQEMPDTVLAQLSGFLGIRENRSDASPIRPNDTSQLRSVPRWAALKRQITHPGVLSRIAKQAIPGPLRGQLRECIDRLNQTDRPVLSEKVRRELADYFAPEIGKLEALLGSRLSETRFAAET